MNNLEHSREEFIKIFEDFSQEDYDTRMKILVERLDFYRANRKRIPSDPWVRLIENGIKMDAQYIQTHGNDDAKASHNAFVLRYAGNMTYKAIAHKMHRTVRSVYEIIARARKRMMIYVFGIDGLER